jgi:hypothetical protein
MMTGLDEGEDEEVVYPWYVINEDVSSNDADDIDDLFISR